MGVLILGLLVAAFYGVMNVGNVTYFVDMGLLDLEHNARQAMNYLTTDLRASFDVSIDNSDPSHITFATPQFPATEFRHIDSNGDGVRDRIVRQREGQIRIIANEISDLCFCWDAVNNNCRADCTDLFTIRVRAAKNAGQRPLSFILIEQVRSRN